MSLAVTLVLGVPGSGKSTACCEVARLLRGTWFAASLALRRHIEKDTAHRNNSWLKYWERGESAPDAEVLPVLWEKFASIERRPVLLDGYPRTSKQFDDFMRRGGELDAVILLSIDDKTALERVRARSIGMSRVDDENDIALARIRRERVVIDELLALERVGSLTHKIDANRGRESITGDLASIIAGAV